ncbi:MAG: N-acetylmuramoyl-L-alanine amidase [Bacteroidia bacterium]
MIRLSILFLLVSISHFVNANPIYSIKIEVESHWNMSFIPGFTSFSVSGISENHNILAVVGSDTIPLRPNTHFSQQTVSQLVAFNNLEFGIELINLSKRKLQLQLSAYNANYSPLLTYKIKQAQLAFKKNNCDLPPVIDQKIWREGLPDPKPNPSTTNASHLVVHHSATSNTATDYLLAVRNIYLYHINNNGWDDVGYNYLIDPNGVLYAGRDGQGKNDDEIKGAHFCGKNSNTMGICLIGNYSQTPVSDSMQNTLEQLLAWKAKKNNIQPLESQLHPKGVSNAIVLNNICGHRDGCATECPGNYAYQLMDSIKTHVAIKLVDCGFSVHAQQLKTNKTFIIKHNKILLNNQNKVQYFIFDPTGRLLDQGVAQNQIELNDYSGLLIVHFKSKDKMQTIKLFRNGN